MRERKHDFGLGIFSGRSSGRSRRTVDKFVCGKSSNFVKFSLTGHTGYFFPSRRERVVQTVKPTVLSSITNITSNPEFYIFLSFPFLIYLSRYTNVNCVIDKRSLTLYTLCILLPRRETVYSPWQRQRRQPRSVLFGISPRRFNRIRIRLTKIHCTMFWNWLIRILVAYSDDLPILDQS